MLMRKHSHEGLQTRSSLEDDIQVLKEDNRHLEERLKGALADMYKLSEHADVEKNASATSLAELEDMIRRLKYELDKMTSSSKKKEDIISNDNCKIEQLHSSLTKTQRELDVALAELEKERYNIAVKDDEIQELDSVKRGIGEEASQLRSSLSEKEDYIQRLEVKLKIGVAEHELKLKNMEEDFSRTRELRREKHRKGLQSKLKEQQLKHLTHLNIYQKRVDHLEAEIETLKVHGEHELKSLNSQVTDREDNFKLVCLNFERKLQESQRKGTQLEESLELLAQELRSRERQKVADIESLNREVEDAKLAEKNAEAAALQSYLAKLEQKEKEFHQNVEDEYERAECAIQKLNEMHAIAIEVALHNHQMERDALKNAFEETKAQEIRVAAEKYQKQIEEAEAEFEEERRRFRREQDETRVVVVQQQNALVMAHQHALEAQMKKAEVEVTQLKETHAREMAIAVSRSTEKVVLESLTLHDDHKKRLERLSEVHRSETQKLNEIHAKETEKTKSHNSHLMHRITDLENMVTLKEQKLKDLSDNRREIEIKSESALKELRLSHEKAFNFQRCKFSKDKEAMAKQLEKKYRTELDACNTFHAQQYQNPQQDLNRSKVACFAFTFFCIKKTQRKKLTVKSLVRQIFSFAQLLKLHVQLLQVCNSLHIFWFRLSVIKSFLQLWKKQSKNLVNRTHRDVTFSFTNCCCSSVISACFCLITSWRFQERRIG
ncbi:CAP-Gly domain-containing linker protein 1 isoform X2 [Selaginella moellendorffii]|uniref:CAP-Gly domain-containing linker protein 1 isoform X2 n=1 Tax=Selaginella moellendorffii TaxID=88036 RepID=UPI000D1CF5A0|nr:CAP-Gly domain-containing linker protein 1 isoform X2 [Selaginella moellendorffii]|eukprot:XP_024515714.1 CAP-Gly domain-containing linker protein 1 isoform X2 [Selaginella moellendorffii]